MDDEIYSLIKDIHDGAELLQEMAPPYSTGKEWLRAIITTNDPHELIDTYKRYSRGVSENEYNVVWNMKVNYNGEKSAYWLLFVRLEGLINEIESET